MKARPVRWLRWLGEFGFALGLRPFYWSIDREGEPGAMGFQFGPLFLYVAWPRRDPKTAGMEILD